MTITTTAFKGSLANIPSAAYDPALKFFLTYAKDVGDNGFEMDPEKYYNARCIMYLPDRSTMEGAAKMMNFFKTLYAGFPKVTRDFLTLIIVSDDEDCSHQIHIEIVTTLHPGEGKTPVPVPQSFVYIVKKADEGKGTDGWQYHELRNYYDYALVQKALAML